MAKEKVDPVQEAADEELRSAKLAEDPTGSPLNLRASASRWGRSGN
jgi:hypothetical protein